MRAPPIERSLKKLAWVIVATLVSLAGWCYWVMDGLEHGKAPKILSENLIVACSMACSAIVALCTVHMLWICLKEFRAGLTGMDEKNDARPPPPSPPPPADKG